MRIYTNNETINSLIDGAMDKIKTVVDSSTIIGEKVVTDDGTIIIPISKVTVGYVVGGGEYADLSSRRVANHFPMAGGSSGGISVTPVGFLIETNKEVSFINVENKTMYQTIMNMFNTILNKIQKEDQKGNEVNHQEEKAQTKTRRKQGEKNVGNT